MCRKEDVQLIVEEVQGIASSLLYSKTFLFWLDWVLRLPVHIYNVNNQPSNPVEKDQKCWLHLIGISRFGVRRDARNVVYFHCVTFLAHMLHNIPWTWERLSSFLLDFPLDDHYYPSKHSMNVAGDVFEASAPLFLLDDIDAISMRKSFGILDRTAQMILNDLSGFA